MECVDIESKKAFNLKLYIVLYIHISYIFSYGNEFLKLGHSTVCYNAVQVLVQGHKMFLYNTSIMITPPCVWG